MQIPAAGHRLHVEALGAGEVPFVCIHGLADTLAVWEKLAPSLAARGRVVLMNQRAHGASGAPAGPYRREDLAADVVAVLDAVSAPQAVLVGHSLGGIVAMTTALAVPERIAGLVLIGTASQCSERIAGWYEKIAGAADAGGIPGFLRAIYGKSSTRDLHGDAAGLAHLTRCLKSLYDDPLTPKLSAIRCPTVLLVGDKDPMGPGASAIIQKQIPGAVLEVIPSHGHWLHVDAPDAVLAAIDRVFPTTH